MSGQPYVREIGTPLPDYAGVTDRVLVEYPVAESAEEKARREALRQPPPVLSFVVGTRR